MVTSSSATVAITAAATAAALASSAAARALAGDAATASPFTTFTVVIIASTGSPFFLLLLLFLMFGFELVSSICTGQGTSHCDEAIAVSKLMTSPYQKSEYLAWDHTKGTYIRRRRHQAMLHLPTFRLHGHPFRHALWLFRLGRLGLLNSPVLFWSLASLLSWGDHSMTVPLTVVGEERSNCSLRPGIARQHMVQSYDARDRTHCRIDPLAFRMSAGSIGTDPREVEGIRRTSSVRKVSFVASS